MLLQQFWFGSSKESALQLDLAAGGSFSHKTTLEGEALLDKILENTSTNEPLRVELKEVTLAVSEPETPTLSDLTPLPELEIPNEEIQLEFSLLEDDLFEDFGNTSKYKYERRPPIPVTPCDPLDEIVIKETIEELTSIMSCEWIEEVELSSEEIQIRVPSYTIRCQIAKNGVDVCYNPTIGANIMSSSFALTYMSDIPLAPSNKTFRYKPRVNLECVGVLQGIHVHFPKVITPLNFHIFDI